MNKKTLKVIVAYDSSGKQLGSNHKRLFSNVGHLKNSNAWANVLYAYEYTINIEDTTITKRMLGKDDNGNLVEWENKIMI